jgi:hypothetical protein
MTTERASDRVTNVVHELSNILVNFTPHDKRKRSSTRHNSR